MNIINLISGIFEPAAKLIDSVHTSTEEKLEIKNKLVTIQNEMTAKIIDQPSIQKRKAKAGCKGIGDLLQC